MYNEKFSDQSQKFPNKAKILSNPGIYGGGDTLRLEIFRPLKVCYPEKNAFISLCPLPPSLIHISIKKEKS